MGRKPTITLHGDRAIQTSAGEVFNHYIQNSAGTFNGHKDAQGNKLASKFEHTDLLDLDMLKGNEGATCDDSCEPTAKVNQQITAVMYHGKHCGKDGKGLLKAKDSPDGAVDNFKLGNWEYVAGDYSILYTCYDGTVEISEKQTKYTNKNERAPLTSSKCRYVDNVDHTRLMRPYALCTSPRRRARLARSTTAVAATTQLTTSARATTRHRSSTRMPARNAATKSTAW